MRISRNKSAETSAVSTPAPETGWIRRSSTPSLLESFRSIAVSHKATPWRKFLTFLGPGYLVAVG